MVDGHSMVSHSTLYTIWLDDDDDESGADLA